MNYSRSIVSKKKLSGTAARRFLRLLLPALFLCLFTSYTVFGAQPAQFEDNPALYKNETPPDVKAEAVILAEVGTGKVLYAKNAHKRMYPASLTKIMTAIISLEYLKPGDLIVAGSEINNIPYDAARANHKPGETLTAENLVRGLIVGPGNDTACILAIEVARRVSGNPEISYSDAEKLFCGLMNDKAAELGTEGTNFTNPHGYHNNRHFTTAYDMLLICAEAMKNPVTADMAKEASWRGNGAGESAGEPGLLTQDYNWKSPNALISSQEYFYSFATGIRTGQTDEAGSCLAASAEKDGKKLICISLFSEDPDRWLDTVNLFEYGFDSFEEVTIQKEGDFLGEVRVWNPPLGNEGVISLYSTETKMEFMSTKQYSAIQRLISFDTKLIYVPEEGAAYAGETFLLPPVNDGDIVGKVSYVLNDTTIFTSDVVARGSVSVRSFNSDVDYYAEKYKSIFFSSEALPYWIIAFMSAGILARLLFVIKRNMREKSKGYRFKRR